MSTPAPAADGPPRIDDLVAVQLELPRADAERLRALGASAWVRQQLARAAAEGSDAPAHGSASDYLLGLAQALFPLPVNGPAVHLVDELRKQRLVEAAVTYDAAPGGDGDRAIVMDITSLGRAEIERLRRISVAS